MAAPDRPSLEELEEQWMTFYLDKGYTDDALTAKVQAALAKVKAKRGSQESISVPASVAAPSTPRTPPSTVAAATQAWAASQSARPSVPDVVVSALPKGNPRMLPQPVPATSSPGPVPSGSKSSARAHRVLLKVQPPLSDSEVSMMAPSPSRSHSSMGPPSTPLSAARGLRSASRLGQSSAAEGSASDDSRLSRKRGHQDDTVDESEPIDLTGDSLPPQAKKKKKSRSSPKTKKPAPVKKAAVVVTADDIPAGQPPIRGNAEDDKRLAKYGVAAAADFLSRAIPAFAVRDPPCYHPTGNIGCLSCLRGLTNCEPPDPAVKPVSKRGVPVNSVQKCLNCARGNTSLCSLSNPAPLVQYFAEGARLHSLTSDHYLAERLRNITAVHAQVTGLSTFLELSYWQYQAQLISFAKDLQMLEQRYHRTDNYWVLSGLCTELVQATLLFETIDSYLAAIKDSGPADVADLVYTLHGRFLNILGHLHGEDPREWPILPPAPTFESKNAPFATMAVKSADPVLALHPDLAAGLASTIPTPKKGKGKAREKTPLFLPESKSISPYQPFKNVEVAEPVPDDSMDQYVNYEEGEVAEEGEEGAEGEEDEESSEDADGEYVPPGTT